MADELAAQAFSCTYESDLIENNRVKWLNCAHANLACLNIPD
jgi:hypothetical protein